MSEVRLIDANAAISAFADMGQDIDTHDVIDLLKEQPTVDAVPWEFLERYADWFFAAVSLFIQEAKAFYKSSDPDAAMYGFTITDGERKKDERTTVD